MSTFEPVVCLHIRTPLHEHRILPGHSRQFRKRCASTNTSIYRLSLTARATSSVVWPRLWPSSSSTARRLLSSAARPSTSPASSSAQSVRPTTNTDFHRPGQDSITNPPHSEVLRLPPQADPFQPNPWWTMALQSPSQDVLAYRPRHDPTQD